MFAQPRIRKVAAPPPKKRKATHAVEEITFDKDARAEYLTGFRKRKQARIKHAKEIAEEKAREERIEMRKQVRASPWICYNARVDRWLQIREERKQAVEEHVETINKILRQAESAGTAEQNKDDSDNEWQGLADAEVHEAPPIDLEEEYIDEDKYTTVTVEAVSVDRDGLHKPKIHQSDNEDSEVDQKEAGTQDQEQDKKGRAKHPTKKKKKFRYESKSERKITVQKERAKRAKKRE